MTRIPKRAQVLRCGAVVVGCLVSMVFALAAHGTHLSIRVIDTASNRLTPARIELLNLTGRAYVANNAVPIGRECVFAPLPDWLAQPAPTELFNPYTGTYQHYIDGVGRYDIPTGTYKVRAFLGSQYRVFETEVALSEGRPTQLVIEMHRWTDTEFDAWYAADGHLHVTRSSPQHNTSIGQWMSAEGLDLANLLQMGTADQFAVTPQYAFGDAGMHRSDNVVLLSGQEHPRTHLLGHTINIGASQAIDERDAYIVYSRTFERSRALGGVNGFAHWGTGPAALGLAVNAPVGLVDFLEVLSFEILHVEVWYQLLNLGLAITATAGTDYPCLPSVPGRERFYVNLQSAPSRATLVQAIRQGRTFVTNGPMLSLAVDGEGIGSRIAFDPSTTKDVEITGTLQFDPAQDQVHTLELIQNGQVIHTWQASDTSEFHAFAFELTHPASTPSWFALRSRGRKSNETVPEQNNVPAWVQVGFDRWIAGGGGEEITEYLQSRVHRESFAHTSPIYLGRTPELDATSQQAWLERLDRLDALLNHEPLDEILIWDWLPFSDGVSAEHLQHNKAELLQAIQLAREHLARPRRR